MVKMKCVSLDENTGADVMFAVLIRDQSRHEILAC